MHIFLMRANRMHQGIFLPRSRSSGVFSFFYCTKHHRILAFICHNTRRDCTLVDFHHKLFKYVKSQQADANGLFYES